MKDVLISAVPLAVLAAVKATTLVTTARRAHMARVLHLVSLSAGTVCVLLGHPGLLQVVASVDSVAAWLVPAVSRLYVVLKSL